MILTGVLVVLQPCRYVFEKNFSTRFENSIVRIRRISACTCLMRLALQAFLIRKQESFLLGTRSLIHMSRLHEFRESSQSALLSHCL